MAHLKYVGANKMDYSKHTRAQLLSIISLQESSISALQRKLKKVQGVSRSRLRRMNQRGKLLIAARSELARLREEAHGG